MRGEFAEQVLHRIGELVELHDFVDQFLHLLHGQRFEVGKERSWRCDVGFGVLIEAAVDGVVRPLEQQRLAILSPA